MQTDHILKKVIEMVNLDLLSTYINAKFVSCVILNDKKKTEVFGTNYTVNRKLS